MLAKTKKTIDIIFQVGLFISQAQNISQFFVYYNQAKMIKIPLDDNFQKAKNILLKPLLLKFKVYLFWTAKSGAKAFIALWRWRVGGGVGWNIPLCTVEVNLCTLSFSSMFITI